MTAYEFLIDLRRRGGFANLAAAEAAARAVLGVLATRLDADEADELAARLPEPLGEALYRPLAAPGQVSADLAPADLAQRVAAVLGIGDDVARSRTEAVLAATVAAVPEPRLRRVLSRRPARHTAPAGHPEPA